MIRMLGMVAAALFLAVPAFAQVRSVEEQRQDFMRASGVCQASVNDQRARGRGVAGSKTFRAQAEKDGRVSTLGTEQARFEYEKCMASQGHPLR